MSIYRENREFSRVFREGQEYTGRWYLGQNYLSSSITSGLTSGSSMDLPAFASQPVQSYGASPRTATQSRRNLILKDSSGTEIGFFGISMFTSFSGFVFYTVGQRAVVPSNFTLDIGGTEYAFVVNTFTQNDSVTLEDGTVLSVNHSNVSCTPSLPESGGAVGVEFSVVSQSGGTGTIEAIEYVPTPAEAWNRRTLPDSELPNVTETIDDLNINGSTVWGSPVQFTHDSDYARVLAHLVFSLGGFCPTSSETYRNRKVFYAEEDLGNTSVYLSSTTCSNSTVIYTSPYGARRITHVAFLDLNDNVRRFEYTGPSGILATSDSFASADNYTEVT